MKPGTKCYVCDARPATTEDAWGIPLCAGCAGRVGAVKAEADAAPAPVDKTPPKAVSVSGGEYKFDVAGWRRGVCVVTGCGGDRGSRLFACDTCWAGLPREVQRFLEQNFDNWSKTDG